MNGRQAAVGQFNSFLSSFSPLAMGRGERVHCGQRQTAWRREHPNSRPELKKRGTGLGRRRNPFKGLKLLSHSLPLLKKLPP